MADRADPQIESSSSVKKKQLDFFESMMTGDDDGLDDMDIDLTEFGLEEEDKNIDYSDDEDLMDDDELTTMLDSTKETRKQLKTGAGDELADDFAEFEDNLIANATLGKKRHQARKRVGKGEAKLPKEVSERLGRANGFYINHDYGQAMEILQETITLYPDYSQPWNTLGLIHEEMGNTTKSLEVRMIAAHMSGSDASLWKELGLKSIENQALRQAVYCFDKAVGLDPLDVDALWDRSFLQKDLGQLDAAMNGFKQILKILPYHFKVINEMAQLYRAKGETKQAITLYEEAMEHHIDHADPNDADGDNDEDDNPFSDKLGYSEINMLSELYLMVNDYRRALDCIKTGIRHVQRRQHEVQWLNRPNDDNEYLPFASKRKTRSRPSRVNKQQQQHGNGDMDDTYDYEDNNNSDDSYEPDSDDNDNNDIADDDEGLDEEAALERQNIPLELRVRMGVCRIYLGQADIAAQHFEYLYAHSPTSYSDLYQDAACAYMDRRFFDLALPIFQKIIDAKEEVEMDLLVQTADCYRETGDLETAMVFYINVLDERPDNLEVMTSLAMVYEEQGKEDEALELVDYVVRKTREARQKKRLEAKATTEDDGSLNTEGLALQTAERVRKKGSLFDESMARQHMKSEREMKRERRRRDEEERQMDALRLFEKITELHGLMPSSVVQTDRNLMREYIRVALQLWDDFRTARGFFPKKKTTRANVGFYASRRGKDKSMASRIQQARTMAVRLRLRNNKKAESKEDPIGPDSDENEDKEDDEDEEAENKDLINSDHFRNIWLDEWVGMFINLAYILTTVRRAEEAFTILQTVIKSRAVYNHLNRKTALKLALLGCGLISNSKHTVIDVSHWICNVYQFQNDAYRLYSAIFPSGLQDKITYGRSNAIKIFLRHIKLMDGLHGLYLRQQSGTPLPEEDEAEKLKKLQDVIRTMHLDPKTTGLDDYERYYNATDDKGTDELLKDWMQPLAHINPLLLHTFGHSLMIGNNYIGAIVFFMRVYALYPNDPLNTLSLAIANLHRSTQRKTDNRHLQIIKGMQMMSHYCKLRNHNQETEYNMARAYHLLNLTQLAVHHYEKVLILPSAAKQDKQSPKPIDAIYTWPPTDMDDDDDDDDDDTDLKREAAYNLHLIYMTSGATSLAQIVLMKYCTI
ncbi:hypothetical protein BC941DRAFT_513685 [Chlamydoabsidia padenii]|nr:hypothetical protein BC941DRAFT_513685 [Chlamydoabsidia padenii]